MSACSLGGLLCHISIFEDNKAVATEPGKMTRSGLYQGVCGSLLGEQSPTLKAYPF